MNSTSTTQRDKAVRIALERLAFRHPAEAIQLIEEEFERRNIVVVRRAGLHGDLIKVQRIMESRGGA